MFKQKIENGFQVEVPDNWLKEGYPKLMVVSLIGLMLFSMTMAVALGLLVSVMKEYPGLAFGLTTVGLFFGVFIAAFIKFDDLFVNCVSLAVMTLISYFALRLIVRKDRKNGSN